MSSTKKASVSYTFANKLPFASLFLYAVNTTRVFCGIGHVKGGGTLDHQFKVSIWLNNFVKRQERDKVWQCLAGSVALNVNFEVSSGAYPGPAV